MSLTKARNSGLEFLLNYAPFIDLNTPRLADIFFTIMQFCDCQVRIVECCTSDTSYYDSYQEPCIFIALLFICNFFSAKFFYISCYLRSLWLYANIHNYYECIHKLLYRTFTTVYIFTFSLWQYTHTFWLYTCLHDNFDYIYFHDCNDCIHLNITIMTVYI